MIENTETLGNRIRKLRLSRNVSMKEVAQTLHVPTSTYRDWEYGRAISGEPYVELAKFFGVSLRELLTGADEIGSRKKDLIDQIENLLGELKKEVL